MASVEALTKVFTQSIQVVRPDILVQKCIARHGDMIFFGEKFHVLNHNVHVVGFGKAVSGMYSKVYEMIGDHIVNGVLSVPVSLQDDLNKSGKQFLWPCKNDKTLIFKGAKNNMPDSNSLKASEMISSICDQAGKDDLVIALVSGGGSALLSSPVSPLSLDEKVQVTKLIASKGASIEELNAVRKSISSVKGGKLSQLAYPAEVWGLILSDVINDPIEDIASGPTVLQSSADYITKCEQVVDKYKLKSTLPENFIEAMEKCKCEALSDSLSLQKLIYSKTTNRVIGSNRLCTQEAITQCTKAGYFSVLTSCSLLGNARKLANFFIQILEYMCSVVDTSTKVSIDDNFPKLVESSLQHGFDETTFKNFVHDLDAAVMKYKMNRQSASGICLVGGGETTTVLSAHPGKGGRNQEMALAFALHLKRELGSKFMNCDVTFLSCGTDGQDGPTDATGAVVSSSELASFDEDEALSSLERSDSYGFFEKRGKGLVKTGITGTNVMDLQIMSVSFK